MTRPDSGAAASRAPHTGSTRDVAGERSPRQASERSRQHFNRCMSAAEREVRRPDDEAAVQPDPKADPKAEGASGPPAGPPNAQQHANLSGPPLDPQVAAAVGLAGRAAERWSIAEQSGVGEPIAADGPSAAPFEAGRGPQMAAQVEAPPPARAATSEASLLAQSMLSQLPLTGGVDRTLTVSFPGASGAVEQIALTVSGGLVHVVVTARLKDRDRERVAAALPELARLMSQRGIRVGAVGLG